jgi:hypothetical protein
MKEVFAILGAGLAVVSTLPYIVDTIRKRTKPNIVSWMTWTILTLVATAASLAAREPRTALLIGASSICTGAVVVAGLWHGIAKFSWFDGLCQAGAVGGLVLWLVFDSPTIGIIVPVAIDFVAMLPTLRHSWLKPGEETWQTFLIGVIAPVLTILSLAKFSVNSLLYPFYLFVANLLIVVTVVYRRRQLGISMSRSRQTDER